MSMEGIEQNPIVYDLMSEMAFHHRQVDLQVKLYKPFSGST
jgi:alpha-N-acetylglucosaminidase